LQLLSAIWLERVGCFQQSGAFALWGETSLPIIANSTDESSIFLGKSLIYGVRPVSSTFALDFRLIA
jgi:hypothetical protein